MKLQYLLFTYYKLYCNFLSSAQRSPPQSADPLFNNLAVAHRVLNRIPGKLKKRPPLTDLG